MATFGIIRLYGTTLFDGKAFDIIRRKRLVAV
jgi:hypothetical protein